MKSFSLQNWQYKPELELLLMFSQRMVECVFFYTYESYKYPALYTATLCREALELISRVERGEFSAKSVNPIIEELRERIKIDIVAKSLAGDILEDYLIYDENNLKDCKIRLRLLYNKIGFPFYILAAQESIYNIVKGNKDKKKLHDLVPNYVAALLDAGFSLQYIRESTISFFFKGNANPQITSIDDIKSFFGLFKLEQKVYNVIFKGSKLFGNIINPGSKFDLNITSNYTADIYIDEYRDFYNLDANFPQFIVCRNIESFDYYSAKELAEFRLKRLFSLFNCFHHKKLLTWSEQAVVISTDGPEINAKKIGTTLKPMLNCKDMFPDKAAERLNLFLNNFGLSDRNSFNRFSKLLDLHSISSQTPHFENQLLQLWIAVETVLVGYESTSKIDQVLQHFIPCLMLDYLKETIGVLTNDLSRWNKDTTKKLLNEINQDDSDELRVTQLVCLEKHSEIRKKFYNELSQFPLLKFRLYNIYKIFSSSERLSEYYHSHKKRIEWQLRRIYMTRNLIVHTGYVPHYIAALIENLHKYIDILTVQIINLVTTSQVTDIAQSLKEIYLLQKKHQKLIDSTIGKEIDESNWKHIVFGYSSFDDVIDRIYIQSLSSDA